MAENNIEEIDIETAQMIVQAAEQKRIQEFIRRYDELCKEFGLQVVPNVQMGIKKL